MAVRCALALVLCAGCFFKPDPPSATGSGDSGVDDGGGTGSDASLIDAPPAAWLPNYTRRRRITMTRPALPAGALTNFPVSVLIENDDDIRDHTQSESELVFTDGTGLTEIEYEITRYQKIGGVLEAWARVPSVAVGTTDIYLYYNGPLVPLAPKGAWNNAYAVWHMDGVTAETDVMGYVGVLTAPAGNVPARSAGIVGFGRTYDGDDYLCRDQTNVLPVEAKAFSYSLWTDPSISASSNASPFTRGGTDNNPGFGLVLTNAWTSYVTDGSVASIISLGAPTSTWTQLAIVVDNANDTIKTYVNGAPYISSTAPNLGHLGNAGEMCVGGASLLFKGSIDEVRVWDGALPDAWFATEYLNLTARTTFMSIAAEEAR